MRGRIIVTTLTIALLSGSAFAQGPMHRPASQTQTTGLRDEPNGNVRPDFYWSHDTTVEPSLVETPIQSEYSTVPTDRTVVELNIELRQLTLQYAEQQAEMSAMQEAIRGLSEQLNRIIAYVSHEGGR